ncbi:hypothetical protein M9Y10_038067 [Tritrichomonas musculus]|uniref:E3 ubiquitin protein ligase n=1 Tax=Tritrichomonas musculus TaxID=1915356 RepID=A0ABR2K7C8_9EUKA
MMEEKWIRKFLANNPFLTDRMKKLEEQRRVESIIMNDLGYIVAYQHDFIQTISLELVRLKRFISTYKNADNENTNHDLDTKSYKNIQKHKQLANKEDTIRLIKLANQLKKALFKIVSFSVSQDDDFALLFQIHNIFDEMIYYRNLKCTKYRNTFAPLPLFRISHENSNSSTPSKCHGFSKLLCRSSPYIDFTYIPTKYSINQIEKTYSNGSFHDFLKNFLNELNLTNKELLILKSEYKISNILIRDFTLFPPYDVIRESPTFSEFSNFISYSINYVRSEITSLHDSISNLITLIIPKLESSVDCISCLPQIELEMSHNTKNNFYEAKHKLLFFQNIIQKTDVFKNTVPDYESIKYIHFDHETFSKLNDLKDTDYEGLSSLLELIIENYYKSEELMSNENKDLERKQEEINKMIKQWQEKNQPTIPEEIERKEIRLIKSTQQLRTKIEKDQAEIPQLMKDTILEFKEKIKDLKVTKPLFPLNFEDMLINYFQGQPKLDWINQKLNHHQKENEKMNENVKNLKLNNEELKKEIDEKKKILELLKNKAKNSDHKDNKDGFHKSSHRSKLLCSICKSRQRDSIITICGHTFCRKCLMVLLRKGSHHCPHCDKHFSQSDIKQITW